MSMAIVIPLFTLPQLLKIWMDKSADGVSLATWSVYCISTLTWLAYGVLNKDKKLITLNILLIFINTGIVLGILTYG